MVARLLNVFLKERLSLRRIFGQKIAQSQLQRLLMIGLLVYAFGVTALSNGMLNYQLALSLNSTDQINQLWINFYTQLTGLGFIFGFFQAQGYLFQYKDFDLLGSLPIAQRHITFAKLMMMLVFVYLFAIIIVGPIYIVWWIFVMPPFWHVAIFLSLFLLTPLPMLLLGSFISYWIRRLTQRWINANVIQTIFSVLFIVVFVLFTSANPFDFNGILPEFLTTLILNLNFLQRWFYEAIALTNVFAWIGFLSIHTGLLILFIWVMSGPLLTLNQNRQLATFKSDARTPQQIQSLHWHLIKKEWQRFIGTSIYFLNTGFGIILLIVAALMSIFFPNTLLELTPFLTETGIHPFWVIFFVSAFAMSTVYTPAVSLSLEGKNLGLLKTLPLQAMTIYRAKIFFNIYLTLPAIVFATIVFGLIFSIDWFIILAGGVSLILLAIFLSIFFLFINLWFPRFDYHHEVEVVKQSLAALLAIFGGFAWLALIALLVFGLLGQWLLLHQIAMVIIIEMVLIYLAWSWLKRIGEARFQALNV
jgi:ABC-2 type transport system permease protein